MISHSLASAGTRVDVRNRGFRRTAGTVLRLVGLLLALLMAAGLTGCEDDPAEPSFENPPVTPVEPWFMGAWGSSSSDVYLVGQPGLIAHFDGDRWTFEASGTTARLTDVFSPDGGATYYACGHGGVILRNTGSGWTRMESGTSENLFGLGVYDGSLHAVGRAGTVRRLTGGTWSDTAPRVIVRDRNDAPVDTLTRRTEVANLNAVTARGIGGLHGQILMNDDTWGWQLRVVRGGREGVTAGWGDSSRLEGNLVATDRGRLFQLVIQDERLTWSERYSPALYERIGGMWAQITGTTYDLFLVTWNGTVVRETIVLLAGESTPSRTDHERILEVPALEFYDIWGAAPDDLFVCGKSLTVYRYHDPDGGDNPEWRSTVLTVPQGLAASR
ncbi:MAG: hypothetical protein R6X25_00340 [Candidatus Krumholzibacteriia bacterium]